MPETIKPLISLFTQYPQLTVITATRRLARRLLHEYHQQQLTNGLKAWPTPSIKTWSAWVQGQWTEAAIQSGENHTTLTSTQSRQLWQVIITTESDHLLNIEATARQAETARQLVHDYALDLSDETVRAQFVYDPDASHWLEWHRQYEIRLAQSQWLDVPAVTRDLIHKIMTGEFRPAAPICLVGFDSFTPLQWQLIRYLQSIDGYIESPESQCCQAQAYLYCASDPNDELRQAASWARKQFETQWQEGGKPIGVIVPRLEQSQRQAERIFREVFYPQEGSLQTWSEPLHRQGVREASAFHISLGHSLNEEPLVISVYQLLSLCQNVFSYDQFSQLIRSPFITWTQASPEYCSALDFSLRKKCSVQLDLGQLLLALRDEDDEIYSRFEALKNIRDSWQSKAGTHEWVNRFQQCLALFGWLSTDQNDHYNLQVMQAFDETLSEFSRMSVVHGDLSLGLALHLFTRIIDNKIFQPGAGEQPVQVMGMLESAGISFSSLWVSGMTEQEWPSLPQPTPFIPIRLQQEFGMPHASPQQEYDYAHNQTQRLLHTAEEIIFSYPQHSNNDEVFLPSPLIFDYPLVETSFAESRKLDEIKYETLFDNQGPQVDTSTYQAGTSAIKDQSACPFRAFVQHRLKSQLPEDLEPGSDPRLRGQMVHEVMEDFWCQWKTSDSLHAMSQEQLQQAVNQSVGKVVNQPGRHLPGSALIEQQRLVNLVMQWLEIEKQRQPFEVVNMEEKLEYEIDQLRLIMRIDRIDRLADGSLCVIDYKTGDAKSSQWVGERPEEPQIPLYALSQWSQSGAGQAVNAVAYASIRSGECKYEGVTHDRALIASTSKTLPGIRQLPVLDNRSIYNVYDSWDDMLAEWQANIADLVAAHIHGDAAVDPRDDFKTCRYCDVHAVCRWFEWDGEEVEQ